MKESFASYFDDELSMKAAAFPLQDTLKTIAERYTGENPGHSFRFRAFRSDGFRPDADGIYKFDLNEKYPESESGQCCLLATEIYRNKPEKLNVQLRSFGKTVLYLNGKIQKTGESAELFCEAGRNSLLMYCEKTGAGFGCEFGPAEPFWSWIPFFSPFSERRGQGGFVYSCLFKSGEIDPEQIDLLGTEKMTGLKWYPDLSVDAVNNPYSLEEIFGHHEGCWCCVWTKLIQRYIGGRRVILSFSESECFIDGKEIKEGITELSFGEHDVLLVSQCPGEGEWRIGFSAVYESGGDVGLKNPGVSGCSGAHLYLGVFDRKPDLKIPEFHKLYGTTEKCYWKIDRNTHVRPYLEESAFGKFSYPMGVTLYGLAQTARLLDRPDMLQYVKKHVRECVSMYEYSLWDRDTFGYPEINNQIVTLGCLDACGSFGSAMLEIFRDEEDINVRKTAEIIADYIENRQARLPDGTFYRPKGLHPTMWADDQYMSIPFLCRYWKASGEEKYLEEAVRQVLLFKKHLYIPEKKIMSHVMDFDVGCPNMVPWGRGNGWTLFSLSELLEYLPDSHEKREELHCYFRELCEGYLALQGSRGLWHQVLTMPDSYEETSCTAMFIYGFCRAVRFGWVDDELGARLFAAAVKGWEGLQSHAVDRYGNIYGICKGSLYSYDADYYKSILGWCVNDTHGIGIVLLAGAELEKLTNTRRT